jgi:Tfp pilus assembly protein FimT
MDMGRRGELKTDARQLKDNLARARMEAIRRNQIVTVLFDLNGNDYTVFEDKDNNGTYDNDGSGDTDQDILVTTISTDSTIDATDLFAAAPYYMSWGQKGQPTSFNVGLKTIEVSANGVTYKIIVSMVGSIQVQR